MDDVSRPRLLRTFSEQDHQRRTNKNTIHTDSFPRIQSDNESIQTPRHHRQIHPNLPHQKSTKKKNGHLSRPIIFYERYRAQVLQNKRGEDKSISAFHTGITTIKKVSAH